MTAKDKLQHLLITQLLNEGEVELVLPDGMIVAVGITQEGRYGDLEKQEGYCWMIASQKDRTVSMDNYNVGLRFLEDSRMMVIEDHAIDRDGQSVCLVDVI